MPFFLKVIKWSPECNIALNRQDATTLCSTNHTHRSINKRITCTNTSSKKSLKPNLSSTLWVIFRNPSSHQNRHLELLIEDAQSMRMNPITEHDGSLVLSQHLPLVQDSSWENQLKMQHAMHFPFSIFAIPLKTSNEKSIRWPNNKRQQQGLRRVPDRNNEKFATLRDEIRLTQESVEKTKEDSYTHILYMLDRIYILEDAFRCYQFESAYRHFLQSSQLYLSQFGTLYTHFKAFRAAFYAYRKNYFSTISSLATGDITHFLLPTQFATILQELAAEEFVKGSKLTPVIPSGFEAIYNGLQLVLEVTMLPKVISFVLGISMNSKSATYIVFQAEPLCQPRDDGKTASVYQFPKPYVAIATDNTIFAELAASTLEQCTGINRIKLCRKIFLTTTDQTLLYLTSLYFN